MIALPPVRYVNIGEESIAYRDDGGSGLAIVYAGTNASHQDLMWTSTDVLISCARWPRSVAWSPLIDAALVCHLARSSRPSRCETDVRDVLPLVRAPTLVATPSLVRDFAQPSRYVADHVAEARAVEIPARDQWPFGDGMDAFLDATSNFLVDVGQLEPIHHSNRRLAAVLFTDIVGSTERLRSIGDQRWRTTMDSHDDVAHRAVTRDGGRVVKSTGDGSLAVFDGPVSAVMSAVEILRSLRRIGLSARAGVHVGELDGRGDDVSGIAVTLCSRIADRAESDEVLVSSTVRDLVAGSDLLFESRGSHELKGIDVPVALLAATVGH